MSVVASARITLKNSELDLPGAFGLGCVQLLEGVATEHSLNGAAKRLGMAYSTQRGFGAVHPFTSELRRGYVECTIIPEELDFPLVIGEIEVTECVTISRYTGTALEPCFTQGYGLVFGNNERKSLSMSIVDRALRAKEMEEEETGPAQNPEFVLLHGDNVDASGFVQHIKLPHYVDFQAELSLIRELRKNRSRKSEDEAQISGEQA